MDDLENELWLPVQRKDDELSDENSDRELKQARLPLAKPVFAERPMETGFHWSTRVCLEHIREAMLHHRWQEAAEYMAYYPQALEDTTGGTAKTAKHLIFRLSAEILRHHPNSKMDDYNNIYERMKHAGVKNYLLICLEHAFHLLLHGQIDDAKRHLSLAESWRYGKETTAQSSKIKLVQAYRSLLDYIIWCDKKAAHSSTSYDDPADNQDMLSYFRQASVNLKEILGNPGVWDPFILAYTEMLEFYDNQHKAMKVLTDYACDSSFPPNPNAHVYLYEYLQRHYAGDKKLKKVLKSLHSLVPSHELMLDYSSLLLQSETPSDTPKALAVVLDMLDYSCWRKNLQVWTRLQDVINRLQSEDSDDWKEVVSEKMAERQDWWSALHFTRFHAREDSQENPELLEVKASLMEILCPDQQLKYSSGKAINGER